MSFLCGSWFGANPVNVQGIYADFAYFTSHDAYLSDGSRTQLSFSDYHIWDTSMTDWYGLILRVGGWMSDYNAHDSFTSKCSPIDFTNRYTSSRLSKN